MAGKARVIAEKMRKPEEIRAFLRTLEMEQRAQKECGNKTTSFDLSISIFRRVLDAIDTQIKRGETEEVAILEGARKIVDITLELQKEISAHPKVGRDAYQALPSNEQAARQLLLSRSRTLLWVMGEEKNI